MSDLTPSRKPERTCISCRTSDDKRTLVRFVRTPEGKVEIDPSGKEKGRGAYLCARLECFEDARKHRKLGSALRVSISDDDYARLETDFVRLVEVVGSR